MISRISVLVVLVAAAWSLASAQISLPRPPRLLVIVMVDQMRADYIERYGHQWTAGLKRLIEGGAWFRTAAYPYMNTVTCAGHATVATGAFPNSHGMVLNEWWDRGQGRSVSCVHDPDFPIVSYAGPASGGISPRTMRPPTLGDELRAQSPTRPYVVSMSMKDRSAVPLGGHRPDVAVWFSNTAGGLVTSTYYRGAPVSFVKAFIDRHPVEADFGRVWTKALPEDRYLFEDTAAGELPPAPWTAAFPHALPASGDISAAQGTTAVTRARLFELWRETPFADVYLSRLAQAAVEALPLGRGPGTDVLAVAFSALDAIGHDFGPWSHEAQDALVRLDQTIGELLTFLDRRVGAGEYVVGLSSDHGVTPIPELSVERGIDSGRIRTADVTARLQRALEPFLGSGKHVARVNSGHIYFSPGVADQVRANPALLRATLESLRDLPGILRVIDGASLAAADTRDPIVRAAALSYDPARSGDLVIALRPYWLFRSEDSATSHGSANLPDARVPVILFGRGIRPGQYLQPATPADIAPTLAFLAGITMSSTDGRILAEALAPVAEINGARER